jgi:hypothetical protein
MYGSEDIQRKISVRFDTKNNEQKAFSILPSPYSQDRPLRFQDHQSIVS